MKTLVLLLSFSVGALAADPSGVANFHQVNAHVYRGAQPSTLGFEQLAHMGIKTIIDLREGGSRAQAEKRVVEKDGMRYINMPFAGLGAPSDVQVAKVLAVFDDPASGPVFVHCRRGADRTGTVVACYRILTQHWKNQQALAEARQNGMAFFERAMMRYVLAYQPAAVAADLSAASSTGPQ